MDNLFNYKYELPLIENAVCRDRLLSKADGGAGIILIEAPAGHGKTYLAYQLSKKYDHPTVWYRIDESDNDRQKLAQGLLAAVSFATQNRDFAALMPAGFGILTAEIIMTNLKKIYRDGLTVVFDDLQLLTQREARSFLFRLLEFADANIVFLLTSRDKVHLDFDLAAKRTILRFSPEELLFTREELDEYIEKRNRSRDEAFAVNIYEMTEGWIAAVNLLLLFETQNRAVRIAHLHEFSAYVQTEVLGRLDQGVKSFLISTSLFRELDPAVCDSFLGIRDSAGILHKLEADHCLIYLSSGGIYRLHDLLRNVLLDNLKADPATYGKAAAAYLANGLFIQAVDFLLPAGDFQEAKKLMKLHAPALIRTSNWITIRRWLSHFDPGEIMQDAYLCILMAEVKLNYSSVFEAEKYWQAAVRLYEAAGDGLGCARCLNVRARILRSQGKYKESIVLMEEALTYLAGERFDISMETALSYLFLGDFANVEKTLQNAYEKALKTMDNTMIAHIVSCLAHFSYLKGDYTKSVALYKKAAALSGSVYYSHFQRSCLATIYQDWGMLEKALEIARESVEIKERYQLQDTQPYAYYQLAHIYVDLQQFDKAEIYYNKAIQTAEAIGGETFFRILSKMLLARCYIKRGQIKKTRETARQAVQEAMEEGGYIEAICCLLMGIIFLQVKKMDRAKEFIARGRPLLEKAKPKYFVSMLYGALAYIAALEGQEQELVRYGTAYLDIAGASNFIGMGVSLYSMFSVVFSRLPEDTLSFAHREFISELNERCEKKPFISKFFGSEKLSVQNGFMQLRDLYDSRHTLPFTVNMFGSLELFHGGERLNLKGRISLKAKQLLEFLLHAGRAVTKEEIIELLWPESVSRNLNDLFHATLYNLRRGLKRINGSYEYILYADGAYRLKPDVFFCAHHLFSDMLPLLGAKRFSEEEASLLYDILQYYEGAYLKDTDSEWAGKSRAYYEVLFEKAALRVSGYYINGKEALKVTGLLYALLELNPYSEDGNFLLMKALIDTNQPARAMRLFEDYAKMLEEELGLTPPERMKELVGGR